MANLGDILSNQKPGPGDLGTGDYPEITGLGGMVWSAWIPVFTGFSVDPTINAARYVKVGKMVTVHINMNNGTSNATTFTMTLPVAAANTAKQHCPLVLVTNNGTSENNAGMLRTNVNSTVADLFRNGAGLAWSNVGGKKTQAVFTYESV